MVSQWQNQSDQNDTTPGSMPVERSLYRSLWTSLRTIGLACFIIGTPWVSAPSFGQSTTNGVKPIADSANKANTPSKPEAAQTGDALMDSFGLTDQYTAGAGHKLAPIDLKAPKSRIQYLMSAFPATSQDRLSLFLSDDGRNFVTLATETYKPVKGLLRDPSIMRDASGIYHIVYTTGWTGTTIGLASSRDLKHWKHDGDIEVGVAGIQTTWAPEWFQDANGDVYVIVSLSKANKEGPFEPYALKALNKGLTKFALARPLGIKGNHIDTFIVRDQGRLVAITKNETDKTLERATAPSLFGQWTIDRTGNWAQLGTWIEGPALVPISNAKGQSGWRLYFDEYRTKKYFYADSFDGLETFSPRLEIGAVSGAVRHMTVISVDRRDIEAAQPKKFKPKTISWDRFSLKIDGKRVMIWSGEIHAFRLPSPDAWRDVLQKMKVSGYNSVALYFDWGYHSAAPGAYDFSGIRDMERIIEMAEEEGMYIIVRPGPYVNAELTMGGFPGWLARQKALARSDDPSYVAAVDGWMSQINAIIARHQITTGGGNIIAYQLENELADTSPSRAVYMKHLADKARLDGITVPLFHNSAGRLPNWTPKGSTAPFAVEGPTDLYGFDGYPGGNCTVKGEPGKPNKAPNWGMFGEMPPADQKGPVKIGALASPNTPGFAAEIGSGWFDFWGSVGTYNCTAQRLGPAFQRVFYGANLINGISIHNVYMAYGGTSWGWLPASVVFSSYDYGAGIDEARSLRPKQMAFKQLGQFVDAAEPLLAHLDKAEPIKASNPNVKLYHTKGVNQEGRLIFAVQEPSNATNHEAFHFEVKTRDGALRLPNSGDMALKGHDAKLLLLDYELGRTHLVYTTSETQTVVKQGARDVALMFGRRDEPGQTVFKFSKAPMVQVLSGTIKTSYDAKTRFLTLDYRHNDLAEILITEKGKAPLLLVIAETEVAQDFWVLKSNAGTLLLNAKAMPRRALWTKSQSLEITGDAGQKADGGSIRLWSAISPKSLSFNATKLGLKALSGHSLASGIEGPERFSVPDLMALNWQMRAESPEAQTNFDDSDWRLADLKTSAAIASTQPPAGEPVLAMSDYGFHHGDVWYRGRFDVSGTGPDQISLRFGGGAAGLLQLWIDGQFIGEADSPYGEPRAAGVSTAKFDLSALKPGPHQISVMVRNHAHNWDLAADDEHKEARGLIDVALVQKQAPSQRQAITWRIQGNQGGETIPDLTRGPMNNGGLFGERKGWYLPVDAKKANDPNWQSAKPDRAPPLAGTYWLRTALPLDLPKGHDIQLGLQIGDATKPQSAARTRVLIFVNGWHIGHFAGHIGPQRTFVIPAGLLNLNGHNTLSLAVTTDGQAKNALEPIKLVVLDVVRGGIPISPVSSPSQTQR